MLRSKDGAAVLIRQDGGFKGVNLAGDQDNFIFVHADDRTQNRHICRLIGAGNCLNGLAGNLTDAFAGDQCLTLVGTGNSAGNFHHITAHDDGEQILRTLIPDGFLDFSEGYDVHFDASAVGAHLLCQI